MKNWGEMSEQERNNYRLTNMYDQKTLNEAIIKTRTRRNQTSPSPGEIALLDRTIVELERQKALIGAKFDVCEAVGTHIRPPTDAEVAAAEARANQTAELQETREGIVAAVAYARVALMFQSEIQSESSSA